MPHTVRNGRIGISRVLNTLGTGLLEQVSYEAVGAYSLRKLSNKYNGSAVRVRRSTDNAETDIGFSTAGDFDLSAFATHIGGGNGFSTKKYDQSGRGFHMSLATAAQQYQIVATSALTMKPNFFAPTPSGGYRTTGLVMHNASMTAFIVMRAVGFTFPGGVLQGYSGATPAGATFIACFPDTGRFYFGDGAGANSYAQLSSGVIMNTNHVLCALGGGAGGRQIYTKGVADGTNPTASASFFEPQLGDGYSYLRGYVAEVILYNRPLPVSDVILIQQNQMAYYGIS